MIRTILAFLLAVFAGFVAASLAHTQMVLHRLAAAGAQIGLTERLETVLADLIGMATGFLPIISIGFLIAFVVGAIVRAMIGASAIIAYPLAGAAAMGAAMFLMSLQFEITPIAGARGAFGLALQVLSGAVGGAVFALTSSAKD